MTKEAENKEELSDAKKWVFGFLGGTIAGVYLVIMVVGPFVLGNLVFRITSDWEWQSAWSWVAAGSAGFTWFLAFFSGFYYLTHAEDGK